MENENQKGVVEQKEEGEKKGGKGVLGKKMIFLFLLGLLIGIFFKTQVFGPVVIGYNDSSLESLKDDFDYEEYEKKKAIAEKAAVENNQANQEGSEQVETAPATGGQCGN